MKKIFITILAVLLVGCVAVSSITKTHDGRSGQYKYEGPVDPVVITEWECINYVMWGPVRESFHMPPGDGYKGIKIASAVVFPNGGIYGYSLYFGDGSIEVYHVTDNDGVYRRATDKVTDRQMDTFKRFFKLALKTWEVRQERLRQEQKTKGI